MEYTRYYPLYSFQLITIICPCRYLHNVLLVNIIPRLCHRNLLVINVIHQVRRPYERIAEKEITPTGAIDTEIAQLRAIAGDNGADIGRGAKGVDQCGGGDIGSWARGTAEAEFKAGTDFSLGAGDVGESELDGGVHG